MKKHIVLTVAGVGLVLLGACADTRIHGSVEGEPFGKALSAYFMTDSSNVEELLLVITNYPEACTTYTPYFKLKATPSEEPPLNAIFVRFYLREPVSEQSYDILANDETYSDGLTWVRGYYNTYLEYEWAGPRGEAGSIEVDSIDDEWMTGQLSLTLTSGDTLEGKFAAEYCDEDM